jgi:UDP-glucose-4-epimerase GalE
MSILITGGAGFIGSHTAKLLSESGRKIVILDNLTTGRRENVRWGDFVLGDILDGATAGQIVRDYGITAVVHLAAYANAGQSVHQPELYFSNNVGGSLTLLQAMVANGVRRLVFASSCSVYGNPPSERVAEHEALDPLSPYGESKLFIERVLPYYERVHGLRWIALRYFNVAGAEGDLGEDPGQSSRIIPRAVGAALAGGRPVEIFGTTYPTCDGTAVRDYVDVGCVARANLRAVEYVEDGGPGTALNIGSGAGVSVRQILEAVGRETGRAVPFLERAPREGDPARVIAEQSTAREVLGWSSSRDLHEIVAAVVLAHRLRSGSVAATAHVNGDPGRRLRSSLRQVRDDGHREATADGPRSRSEIRE